MYETIDPVLVIALLLNFFILGTSRLRAIINVAALQGAVLATLPVLVHRSGSLEPWFIAGAAFVLKGPLIRLLLLKAIRETRTRREIEPLIGYLPTMLLGALGTGLALVFAETLPLAEEHVASLLVPASLSTVLTGFLILTTRKKAITQVVGYLVLENGIFIMAMALLEAMPFFVEIGVLLDLVVGIFVMGIIVNQINREFASIDAERLTALKE